MSMTVAKWLRLASDQLALAADSAQVDVHGTDNDSSFTDARLDAEVLLCHVLNCTRTSLFTWPEKRLTEDELQQVDALLVRRVAGEPVAYVTGEKEFWSLRLKVNKHVLVPRPETELLVELVLSSLHKPEDRFANLISDQPIRVLDAGTGSGAIAIALAFELIKKQFTDVEITASDNSMAALAVAKQNAAEHANDAIEFKQSNWLSEFADNSFNIIISNPPYIASNDTHLQQASLQHEPELALVSGTDGLDAIREIVRDAPRAGVAGCWLLMEHGHTQAGAIRQLLHDAGYEKIQSHADLAGHERVTSGFCPQN